MSKIYNEFMEDFFMKNTLIEKLKELIKEHEESNYCIDYELAENELDPQTSLMMAYDVGRYETLVNLLNDLKRMEQ